MNAIALSCITFVCISGGALLGMFLPGHRLSTDDKDVVRLGTGLIGTIAALVLGLLIASAKGSYDTQSTQVTQSVAARRRCFSRSNVAGKQFRRGQGASLRGERRERNIFCETSAAFAAERFPALAASPGNTNRHRHCANPPAAVRADQQLDP